MNDLISDFIFLLVRILTAMSCHSSIVLISLQDELIYATSPSKQR